MRHEETRDNTTAIEATIIAADARETDPDPEDPEHDPIGDAETEYDIEYDEDIRDGTNPTTVCPCGEVVEIEWDHEYNDGWNVCGVECPKCGRQSTGGNARDATVNSWMTTREVNRSNAAFEQMEFEAELYQETGIRFGG